VSLNVDPILSLMTWSGACGRVPPLAGYYIISNFLKGLILVRRLLTSLIIITFFLYNLSFIDFLQFELCKKKGSRAINEQEEEDLILGRLSVRR